MSMKTNAAAAFIAIATVGTANATTIDPNDFDAIFTESYRSSILGGADISGNAAVDGNLNIDDFDMGDFPSSTLIAGRVGMGSRGVAGSDEWIYSDVTGPVEVAVQNFGGVRRSGVRDYSVTFKVLIDGVVAASKTLSASGNQALGMNPGFSLGTFNLVDQSISFMAVGLAGTTKYDVTIVAAPRAAVQPVPLPAGGLMLLAGLGGLAAMRRRKQQG